METVEPRDAAVHAEELAVGRGGPQADDAEQEADAKNFVTSDGIELETVERMTLTEWFANNYKTFGATLEFVTNRSQEGAQFVKGFGGIGGILRYKVDFLEHDYDREDEEDSDSD